MLRKPRLNPSGVADQYAVGGERIAEFTDPNEGGGGGLIAIRHTPDGVNGIRTVVEVYQLDQQVEVRVSKRRA